MANQAADKEQSWTDDDPISTAYWRWRMAQPEVYAMAEHFARELVGHGCTQYSADALLHRVRWHLEVTEGQHYQVNDHYSALIARELMDAGVVPEGFFEVRRRISRTPREPRCSVGMDPGRAAHTLGCYFRGPRLDALISALQTEQARQNNERPAAGL